MAKAKEDWKTLSTCALAALVGKEVAGPRQAAMRQELTRREALFCDRGINSQGPGYEHQSPQQRRIREKDLKHLLKYDASDAVRVARVAAELLRLEKVADQLRDRKTSKDPVANTAWTDIPGKLPQCPDTARCMPNDLLRSALFRPGNRNQSKNRRWCSDELIASWPGTRIIYTGPELWQDDLDVLLEVLHSARRTRLGEPVMIKASELAYKRLRWSRASTSYPRLEAALARLSAADVKITNDAGDMIAVSLLRKREYTAGDGVCKFWVEPEIRALFELRRFTVVSAEVTHGLSQLAKWLYRFCSTHVASKRYALGVPRLLELSGSGEQLKGFRVALANAIAELTARGLMEGQLNALNDRVEVAALDPNEPTRHHLPREGIASYSENIAHMTYQNAHMTHL